jgi:hypothetical protein
MVTGPEGPANGTDATLETLPIGGQATLTARYLYQYLGGSDTSCDGVGIPNAPVRFSVTSGPNYPRFIDTVTGADGTATVQTSSEIPGNEAWLAQTNSFGCFCVTGRYARVIWTKAPTVLVAHPALLSLSPLTFYGAPSATLSRTSPSAALAGKVVTFSTGTTTLCQATTNASGVARCSGADGLLGAFVSGGYTATFAGDDRYLASSATAGLTG